MTRHVWFDQVLARDAVHKDIAGAIRPQEEAYYFCACRVEQRLCTLHAGWGVTYTLDTGQLEKIQKPEKMVQQDSATSSE